MTVNKGSARELDWRKRTSGVIILGALLMTCGVLATIVMLALTEQVWFICPVVAVVGAFVLLFGWLGTVTR